MLRLSELVRALRMEQAYGPLRDHETVGGWDRGPRPPEPATKPEERAKTGRISRARGAWVVSGYDPACTCEHCVSVRNECECDASAVEVAAYERGLRRGLAIAKENEDGPYEVEVDWPAAHAQMEREIEEAKR